MISPGEDGLVLLVLPFIVAALAIGVFAIVRDLQGSFRAGRPAVTPQERVASRRISEIRTRQALTSISRIGAPAALAAGLGFLYFDNASLSLSALLSNEALQVLSKDNDQGQFVQNFLLVVDLLFAILAGSAYSELYQQQEAIYMALYAEVAVAKSLLEQLGLVGRARPWYADALRAVHAYVGDDLTASSRRPPVDTLGGRPADDPLETIMYLTSVGVPSALYETVKELRQARAVRLAAFQRKFPALGVTLLYVLAALELFAFPLLGAGTARASDVPEAVTVSILELQSLIFASVCGCVVLVLRIINELWLTAGGVFNGDDVVCEMVLGLEEELRLRRHAVGRDATTRAGMEHGAEDGNPRAREA